MKELALRSRERERETETERDRDREKQRELTLPFSSCSTWETLATPHLNNTVELALVVQTCMR